MDMKRVTGMDISALNTFAQIKALCDTDGVLLLFSAAPPGVGEQLLEVGAVGKADGRPRRVEGCPGCYLDSSTILRKYSRLSAPTEAFILS